MALPLPPNTTCAVYRTGTAPPAAPAASGVRCHLRADYQRGLEHGEGDTAADHAYTHLLLVELGVDVRDGYSNSGSPSAWDDVYVPDQNGTTRTLKSVLGPKGAILVFFRSADW